MYFFTEVINLLLLYWFVNTCLNLRPLFLGITKIDKPIDCSIKLKDGTELTFSPSATVLGIPIALTCGMLAGIIIYQGIYGLFVGTLASTGIYTGHVVGSFIKRRMKINGGSFLPFIDHGDSIIFASFLLTIIGRISINQALVAIVINYFVQPILSYLGHKIGLRKKPL